MQLVDGHFYDGMMVWQNGLCSQGFELSPPDLRNVSEDVREEVDDMLRSLLARLPDEASLQFSWGCNSDYRSMLSKYSTFTDEFVAKKTAELLSKGHSEKEAIRLANLDWCIANRRERELRYKNMMLKSMLRKEKLYMYLTMPIKIGKLGKKYTSEDLGVARSFFNNYIPTMRSLFGILCPIHIMDEQDYFEHQLEYFNPSLENILMNEMPKVDLDKSILENSYKSDIVGHNYSDSEPYNMFFDSHYHAVGAIEQWPKKSFPGIVFLLTSQSWIDYRLVLNLYPLDPQKEISKTEVTIRKNLKGLNSKSHKVSLNSEIDEAKRKVARLNDGYTVPMKAEFIVHCWSRDKTLVSQRFNALESSLSKMGSAKLMRPELDSTAVNLFAKCMPAGSFLPYRAHSIYCDSDFISGMIPFSSTFVGMEKRPEAIYDGDNNNLVAIASFLGGSPQHGVLIGQSGSGKSANTNDELTQTADFYDCEILVEQGGSFCLYAQARYCKTFFIYNETDIQINYFDTSQLPLSSHKLSSATEIVMQMVGITGDVEKDNIRRGLVNILIKDLYEDAAEDWMKSNPVSAVEATKLAYAITIYREKEMPQGKSLADAYTEYIDRREEIKGVYEDVSTDELLFFRQNPRTESIVRDFCFSFFDAKGYPTHSDLIQYIMIYQDRSIMTLEEQRMLIKLLQVWSEGGQYGGLFDGATNIDLEARTIHFELGLIDENDHQLRQLSSVLVMDFCSQRIMKMPRHTKKRFLCDEAGAFTRTKAGQNILARYYEQFRKYKCQVKTMWQNYSQFKDLPIRATIMNQTSQFMILRMGEKEDLQDLCATRNDSKGLEIAEVTQNKILKHYPNPKHLVERGIEPYSNFCYFHRADELNVIGTVKNICSPEMLTVASSSTDSFEELMRSTKIEMNKGKAFIEAIQK